MEDLRAELAENKEQYDHRLRSLRQEHEKIKTQYEARIASLTASTSTGAGGSLTKGGSPGAAASAAAGGSAAAGSAVKTLPQAQARIRELESDIEKLRAFYIRKVHTIDS